MKDGSKVIGSIVVSLLILSGCDKSRSADSEDVLEAPKSSPQAEVVEPQMPASDAGVVISDYLSDQAASVPESTDTTLGKHQVSLRSKEGERSYVLGQALSDVQLQAVTAAGGQVSPSASGRTGPVLRFGSDVSAVNIQEFLAEAEISSAGQLLEFRMKTSHDHGLCGTCLAENHTSISQVDGVIAVPSYLGDAAAENVDVVVDPLKVSSDDLIKLLEVDHAQLIQ